MLTVPGTAACVGKPPDPTPDLVLPGSNPTVWAAFGAGYDFNCGITKDVGQLICWGSNTAAYMPMPATVTGWDRLFVGSHGVCAIPSNSPTALTCWGGFGYIFNPNNPDSRPWKLVGVGFQFACGILELPEGQSQLKCWGNPNYNAGQLNPPGDPNNKGAEYTDWTAVSAGVYHACGIRGTDSKMLCWGWNEYGQCSDSATRNPGAKSWANVYTGCYHTCGTHRDDNGVMECWGRNDAGQTTVAPATRAHHWSSVSAGLANTCGFDTDDNTFHCWGCLDSKYGQCEVPVA